MIDEQKLVEEMEYEFCSDCVKCGGSCRFTDIKEIINKQPKLNEWIPCSERLPEGCEDAEIELLISTNEEYPDASFEETAFALYYPKTKSFHSVYGNRLEITEIVTAWRYLPEPYIRKKVE